MPERRVTRSARPTFDRPMGRNNGSTWRPTADTWRRARRVIVVLVVAVGVWQAFRVRTISIKGVTRLDSNTVKAQVRQALGRRPWYGNLLFLSSSSISQNLLQGNNRIKGAKIHRRWPSGLEVEVSERQPALLWQTGNAAYVLDNDGSLIGPADQANAGLVKVIDSTNLPVKVGDTVAPPRFVRFCNDLVASFSRRTSLGLVELKLPDTTSEVYVVTNKGYLIKFDTTRDAGQQLSDLAAVLSTLAKQKKSPAEYIDLRVENKAYYR